MCRTRLPHHVVEGLPLEGFVQGGKLREPHSPGLSALSTGPAPHGTLGSVRGETWAARPLLLPEASGPREAGGLLWPAPPPEGGRHGAVLGAPHSTSHRLRAQQVSVPDGAQLAGGAGSRAE